MSGRSPTTGNDFEVSIEARLPPDLVIESCASLCDQVMRTNAGIPSRKPDLTLLAAARCKELILASKSPNPTRVRGGRFPSSVASGEIHVYTEDRRRRGYEFLEAADFLYWTSGEEKLGRRIALRDTAAVLLQMGQKLIASES